MAARFGDSDYREERILQGKPSEKDLGPISKTIGGEWKILLNQLGISHAKMTSLLQENSGSVSSACLEGLVYWRKGNDQCEPATWSVILNAIEKGAEMKSYAQELRDQLLSKKDPVDMLYEEVKELRAALEEKEDREQQLTAVLEEKEDREQHLTAALEEKEDREQQLTAALEEKEEELKKLRQMAFSSPTKNTQPVNRSTPSLLVTREVLLEREQLQNLVQSLRPQIQLGLTTIDALQQEERLLKQHEAEILKSKDFTYKVKVKKQRVIDLKGKGVYTTNCLQCSFTCHYDCAYSDNSDKINCCAMSRGYCENCPKKCKWDQHKNTPYRFEFYDAEEIGTSKELLQRYNIATSDKSKVEGLIASLEDDLKQIHQVVLQMVYSIKQSLQRLSEIALEPNPLSTVDYIDTLIEAEKQQGTQGFTDNIKILEELRKEAALLVTMSEAKFEEWMKTDHKTIFQRFRPKPPPQQWWFNWLTGSRSN